MAISGIDPPDCNTSPTAWSPCGQFVAMLIKGTVEIRGPLTFELLSTFQPAEPTSELVGPLSYSPDGHSLACASSNAIVVWDIQTGGVIREINYNITPATKWWQESKLVWSLDGWLISIMHQSHNLSVVYSYDVALGMVLSSHPSQSKGQYLWAHNKSFLMVELDCEASMINIFEVGGTLTKIKAFPIQLGKSGYRIESFSPTTYHVSLSGHYQLLIIDIRKSRGLLDEGCLPYGGFKTHTFSSDGGHFAASSDNGIHIWEYNDDCYTLWRKFPSWISSCTNLLFSPTSPLILGDFEGVLKLWKWDGPSITSTIHCQQLSIFSSSGAYIITASYEESTVTITNTLSKTPSQLIDTDMEISGLALVGNVLLVMDLQAIVAWQLTEDGLVNNVLGKRRASHSDSIWAALLDSLDNETLLIKDQTGMIGSYGSTPQIYETQCEDVFELPEGPNPWYPFWFIFRGWHHLCDSFMHGTPLGTDPGPSEVTLKEGWVEDHKGRHLLWLPFEWEMGIAIEDGLNGEVVGLIPQSSTVHFESPGRYSIIVKVWSDSLPSPDPRTV